jgi:hypothetical protein
LLQKPPHAGDGNRAAANAQHDSGFVNVQRRHEQTIRSLDRIGISRGVSLFLPGLRRVLNYRRQS